MLGGAEGHGFVMIPGCILEEYWSFVMTLHSSCTVRIRKKGREKIPTYVQIVVRNIAYFELGLQLINCHHSQNMMAGFRSESEGFPECMEVQSTLDTSLYPSGGHCRMYVYSEYTYICIPSDLLAAEENFSGESVCL